MNTATQPTDLPCGCAEFDRMCRQCRIERAEILADDAEEAKWEGHVADDCERDEYRREELEQRDAFEREYYCGVDPQEWVRG